MSTHTLHKPATEDRLWQYGAVAAEYYDVDRHPTCRNFRDATKAFLQASLDGSYVDGITLEVGAGQSLLAECANLHFKHIVLLDHSIEMLSYSRRFANVARLLVGDACNLPIADTSVSLIVASLGDPYNVEAFWYEVARCLRKGGQCLFTVPSYSWARSFRQSSKIERDDAAYFELRDGQRLYLPSFVRPPAEQENLIRQSGLEISKVSNLTANMIPPPLSKKIQNCESIVTGYVAVKR
jgi:SAM-dependent methyltransferase